VGKVHRWRDAVISIARPELRSLQPQFYVRCRVALLVLQMVCMRKTPATDTFSIRLPRGQARFLDKLAKATDRSRNNVISSAIARMMENHEYVARLVAQGDADFDAGRIVEHEDVIRRTEAVVDRAGKK
jgi:predicted transcriptional regulator